MMKSTPSVMEPTMRLKPAPNTTRNINGNANDEIIRERSWTNLRSSRYATTHTPL